MSVARNSGATDGSESVRRPAISRLTVGIRAYIRHAAVAGHRSALVARMLAFPMRSADPGPSPVSRMLLTSALRILRRVPQRLAGGHDSRLIGPGSAEFRRPLNATVIRTAAVAPARLPPGPSAAAPGLIVAGLQTPSGLRQPSWKRPQAGHERPWRQRIGCRRPDAPGGRQAWPAHRDAIREEVDLRSMTVSTG